MKKIIICILSIFLIIGSSSNSLAQPSTTEEFSDTITIEFFTTILSSYCDGIKEYVDTLKNKYPTVIVKEYEVFEPNGSVSILRKNFQKFEIKFWDRTLPAIFFEDSYLIGAFDIVTKLEEEILFRINRIKEDPIVY